MDHGDAVTIHHIAALCIKGSDARSYLQSQFTQDVALLSPSQGIYGAVLTPQGKTVADARVIQIDNQTLWMLHENTVSAVLLQRMRMFALGHDVTITVLPITIQQHHDHACMPSLPLATSTVDDGILLAHADFMHACWHICVDHRAEKRTSSTAEPPSLYAQRVYKGIPRFTVDWHAGDYPLHANLREFNGISFDKGCYVGQEISSRMHWRKGVRHALYHVSLDAAAVDYPCDLATSATIGRLSSCVTWDDDTSYGIARLPNTIMDDDAAERRHALHTVDGVSVTVLKKSAAVQS